MKKILFVFFLFNILSVSDLNSRSLTPLEQKQCRSLLAYAEKKQMDEVYDICGFDDEDLAWYEWAPFVSTKSYKKSLFELCRRYPNHDYAPLYCQKSADLGYPPAYFSLAQRAFADKQMNLYENYLNEVISKNDIDGKLALKTEADFAARQAYEELAKLYYAKPELSEKEKALKYLQVAADNGSASAAHTLGVSLSWNPEEEQQQLSQRYLWKSILLGCPAAEESLGLISYLKQGRFRPVDVQLELEKKVFSCKPSRQKEQKVIMDVSECNCPDVMTWYDSQKEEPFSVKRISANSAVLKDKNGLEYSVVKGDKVTDGYVVEDVRLSAVIVRKVNDRRVLLFRDDIDCVELCAGSGLIVQRQIDEVPPYRLTFTQEECEALARGIETLNNPLKPFKGLPECQLQDWKRWGELALKENRNKHLYLLARYEKSDYIPSKLVLAETLLYTPDAGQKEYIENLFSDIEKSVPTDALSLMMKEKASCIRSKMHIDGPFIDDQMANYAAKNGADEGYIHSINMLGVLYARGLGVQQDFEKATELFKLASEISVTPFMDALENLYILKNGLDLKKLKYGNCNEISDPTPLDLQQLLMYIEGLDL